MKTIRTFLIAATTLMMFACKGQELETTYASQEDQIDRYLENLCKQDPEVTIVRNGGANRAVLKEGTGDALTPDGTISFYYAGYVFTGGNPNASNLFVTNRETTAAEAGWELDGADFTVLTMTLGKDDKLIPGLKDGLVGVKGGEECQILFSGKYGFGQDKVGAVPANSALLYHIWVESITNE